MDSAQQAVEVEVKVRPCNPDCVLFSSRTPDAALTTYYKQLDHSHWVGGVGLHRLRLDGETAHETDFCFHDTPGIFDAKLLEDHCDQAKLLACTVEKSLLLFDIKPEDPSRKPSLLHSKQTGASVVHLSTSHQPSAGLGQQLVSAVSETGEHTLYSLADGGLQEVWCKREDQCTVWCSLVCEEVGLVYVGRDEGYFSARDLKSGETVCRVRQ